MKYTEIQSQSQQIADRKYIIEKQSYDSYQLFYLYTYIFLGHPNCKIGHLILMELFVNHVTFSLIPDAYIEPSFQH